MAARFLARFPDCCPREAARCKLPFALRPGLSQEDKMRTKEASQTKLYPKGKNKRKERRKNRRRSKKENPKKAPVPIPHFLRVL